MLEESQSLFTQEIVNGTDCTLCDKRIQPNRIEDHYEEEHPNFKIYDEQEVYAQTMKETSEYEPNNSSGKKKRGRPAGSKNRLPKKQKINNKVERAAKGLATFTINEQYATETV